MNVVTRLSATGACVMTDDRIKAVIRPCVRCYERFVSHAIEDRHCARCAPAERAPLTVRVWNGHVWVDEALTHA